MADYRTKPASELTYYSFSQPDGRFTISRYDTLDEAISSFKESDNEISSFSGIGISKNNKEIDIVHKSDDTLVLVTDYIKIPALKADPEIKDAVNKAASKLSIVWEYNNNIFNRSTLSSLCIPCVLDNKYLLHNELVDNLTLKPERPDIIFSAIDNFYLSDKEDAVSLKEIISLCKEGKHPKVETINVFVEDNATKELGKIAISPQDYIIMADNYLLSHVKGFPLYETSLAFDKLAGDLNDFMHEFDFYDYMDNLTDSSENVIEEISGELKKGNINNYISFLQEIILEDDSPSETLYRAKELVGRLNKIEPTKEFNKDFTDIAPDISLVKAQDAKTKGDKGDTYLR